MLVADGHLQPSRPILEHGPLAPNSTEDEEYPDECYLGNTPHLSGINSDEEGNKFAEA